MLFGLVRIKRLSDGSYKVLQRCPTVGFKFCESHAGSGVGVVEGFMDLIYSIPVRRNGQDKF